MGDLGGVTYKIGLFAQDRLDKGLAFPGFLRGGRGRISMLPALVHIGHLSLDVMGVTGYRTKVMRRT